MKTTATKAPRNVLLAIIAALACALPLGGCTAATNSSSGSETTATSQGSASTHAASNETETGFFTSKINKLIDKDYKQVMKRGYGNLVIPKELNGIDNSIIPEDAQNTATALHDAGYTAYFVGGAVRDTVLGATVNDWDIVTDATTDQCTELFGDKFSLHYVGTSAYGRVAWSKDGDPVDLAPYQEIPESYLGNGNLPEDTSTSLLSDSFERDLSYNALYYDMFTGDLIDYHGGLHDLRDGITDTIYKPTIQFTCNPVSCLRSIRFTARYGFTLSRRVQKALKNAPEYLEALPKNAICSNFAKFFYDGYATESLKLLERYDVLEMFMPGLAQSGDKKSYRSELEKICRELDNTDLSDRSSDEKAGYALAQLLRPRLEELCDAATFDDAVTQVIAEQESSMEIKNEEREPLTNALNDMRDSIEQDQLDQAA